MNSSLGTRIEQAIEIHLLVTNNQAEYEVVIAALHLARELGIQDVKTFTDIMVVASQVNGEF